MKTFTNRYHNMTALFQVNVDRFLPPLLIVAALFLAGLIFSYATVH
ncbi:MAG: hypothetical protein AAF376_10420 [Pseudomonadota bacterium]